MRRCEEGRGGFAMDEVCYRALGLDGVAKRKERVAVHIVCGYFVVGHDAGLGLCVVAFFGPPGTRAENHRVHQVAAFCRAELAVQ